VEGKLRLEGCIFGEAFDYLKSVVRSGTPKLTIPSPSMMHYRGGRAAIDEGVYPHMEDFWRDLAAVYAGEIAELGKRGCEYLQLDDTSLAYLNDPKQRDYVSSIGGDPNEQHRIYIRNINAALAGKPAGMRVCTHMCRGNFRSAWAAEGGYDHVAEALFNELSVDGFFLEYDDARSGGFEPLRFVPKGKFVVLGLVTTKLGALETADDIRRRIDEAAKYAPLEQLALSPQCGFSSTWHGNDIQVNQQSAKLRLVVDVADKVWG
jgi:5-methyltetrahydropteroyltriglutamate--homocysteine methyltransferase